MVHDRSAPTKRRSVQLGLQIVILSLTGAILPSSIALAHEIVEQPVMPAELEPGNVRGLMEKWRSSGDDAYLDAARTVVEIAVARNPRDAATLLDMAVVLQAQHEFDVAGQLAREMVAIDARNDQARLLLASIHLVRGQTELALEQCNALVQSPIPVIVTCHARIAHARHQPEPSLTRLEGLIAVADRMVIDERIRAWMLSVAGDLAVMAGRPNDALSFFRRSLDFAEATQVRAAMTDVLLEVGYFQEAVTAIDPDTKSLALIVRRLIALRGLGHDMQIANAVQRADHRFRHWIETGDWVHAREMARFYLDVLPEPELARKLAAINIGIQGEPEDQQLVTRTTGLP